MSIPIGFAIAGIIFGMFLQPWLMVLMTIIVALCFFWLNMQGPQNGTSGLMGVGILIFLAVGMIACMWLTYTIIYLSTIRLSFNWPGLWHLFIR